MIMNVVANMVNETNEKIYDFIPGWKTSPKTTFHEHHTRSLPSSITAKIRLIVNPL